MECRRAGGTAVDANVQWQASIERTQERGPCHPRLKRDMKNLPAGMDALVGASATVDLDCAHGDLGDDCKFFFDE